VISDSDKVLNKCRYRTSRVALKTTVGREQVYVTFMLLKSSCLNFYLCQSHKVEIYTHATDTIVLDSFINTLL